MKCPLPKGNFSLKDYPIQDNLIPKVIGGMRFRLHFTFFAKVASVKKMVEMFDINVDGELVRG